MATSILQPAFANGEWSPTLYGRVDLQKYHTAAALLRNFYVDYRGGASNRPGTQFVGQCKQSGSSQYPARLIPFQFSTIQSYVLEFGDQYIRVVKNGAYVLEALKNITGATQANPGVITSNSHGYSNGDWVYIASVGGMTQLNNRTFVVANATTNTFTLSDPVTGTVNTSTYTAYTSGGTVGRVYTIVSPYAASDLPTLKFTQSADIMTLTHPSYAVRDLTRTADNAWTLTELVPSAALAFPTGVTLTASSAGTVLYAYVVTAVTANGDESTQSAIASVSGADITSTANNILITWTAVAGAIYYNVYKAYIVKSTAIGAVAQANPTATVYGFMATTQSTSAVDSNIQPDFSQTPPIGNNPIAPGRVLYATVTNGGSSYTGTPTISFTGGGGSGATAIALMIPNGGGTFKVGGIVITNSGTGYTSAPTVVFTGASGSGATATAVISPTSGEYPGTCSYYQQRLVLAASNNNPDKFWMSQPGLRKNFNSSTPSKDDDAIEGRLVSTQVNAIKHLLPMPGGLIVLTSFGAWQISGGGQASPITPASAQATAQAYNGCTDLPPIVINHDILYVQRGNVVRDLTYNIYVNIYTGTDISLFSSHLFFGYSIREWAYAEVPFKLVWAVRNDGYLLSCAFLKEQEVTGWSPHDTKGQFVSVASIVENEADAVYTIVRRRIQGYYVLYTERLAPRNLANNRENGWFLDCALQNTLTYPNAALDVSAASGTGVTFTATASVFSVGDVGKIIRTGGGIATITSYVSGTQVICTITTPITDLLTTNSPNLQFSGNWSMTAKVTSLGGLWHLEGQTVAVLGDGTRLTDQVVTNGTVTVSTASSLVIVGLSYTAQLQTLAVEIPGGETIQGKRKQFFGVTSRFAQSYGMKVGPTFSNLQTWNPNVQNAPGTTTNGLYTGDYRRTIGQGWNEPGQLCFQQDDPYPVTLLAVVPETMVGDTSR